MRDGSRPGLRARLALAALCATVGVAAGPPAAVAQPAQAMYDLTVEAVHLDGEPPTAAEWRLWHYNYPAEVSVDMTAAWEDGESTTRVPAGTTVLYSVMSVGDAAQPTAMVAQVHTLDVTGDTHVTFDAGDAEEADVQLFDDGPQRTEVSVSLDVPGDGPTWGLTSDGAVTLHTQYTGPELPEDMLVNGIGVAWRDGEATEYHALHATLGGAFTGTHRTLRPDDFARVDVEQGTPAPGATGRLSVHAFGHYHTVFDQRRPLPTTRTLYVTGTTPWNIDMDVDDYGPDDASYARLDAEPVRYEPGGTYRVPFNTGVFGPAAESDGSDLVRVGDELHCHIDLFGDGQGHLGWVSDLSGEATLSHQGEPLRTQPWPTPYGLEARGLPPEETRYELVTTATRGDDVPVSTEVTARFGFRSAYVPGDYTWEGEAIPFSVVRFSPELASDSTAAAGARARVPVTVTGSAAGGNLDFLTVEVSYDRGATWQELPVTDGAVTVTNPAAGGSVSFRAALADRDGNTTEQTILDAYLTT